MVRRVFPVLFVMLAMLAFVSSPVLAVAAESHEGKVVSAGNGKLTMTNTEGKNEHSHTIGSDVKIMRDDKTIKLEELKKGDRITVHMDSGKVTKIEVKVEKEKNK